MNYLQVLFYEKIIGILSFIAVISLIILDAITARAPANLDMESGLEKNNKSITDIKEMPMDENENLETRNHEIRNDGSAGNDNQNSKGEHHGENLIREDNMTESEVKGPRLAHEDELTVPKLSDDKYYLTFDEIMEIENISLIDKIMGMTILGKLSREDAEKLISLAGGGVTMKEFETAKQLLEESLGKEEFEKLMGIFERNWKKYRDNTE